MPVKSLFGNPYRILEKTLDITAKRHGLIASNVANVNTPGYRSKDIPFKKTLQDAMDNRKVYPVRTHPRHFGARENGSGQYDVVQEKRAGIDIEQEMFRLTENNLRYQTGVETLLKKFNGLKYAITEGGR